MSIYGAALRELEQYRRDEAAGQPVTTGSGRPRNSSLAE